MNVHQIKLLGDLTLEIPSKFERGHSGTLENRVFLNILRYSAWQFEVGAEGFWRL